MNLLYKFLINRCLSVLLFITFTNIQLIGNDCLACKPDTDNLEDFYEQYRLKTINYVSLRQFEISGFVINFPVSAQSRGSRLSVDAEGELIVNAISDDDSRNWFERTFERTYSNRLMTNYDIYQQVLIDSTDDDLNIELQHFRSPLTIELVVMNTLRCANIIFSTHSNIFFKASRFEFKQCFISCQPESSSLYFCPSACIMNSPIQYILIIPHTSLIMLDGILDFTTLDFQEFGVTDSDIEFQFRH